MRELNEINLLRSIEKIKELENYCKRSQSPRRKLLDTRNALLNAEYALGKQIAAKVVDNTPTEDAVQYKCPVCNGDITKIRSFYCPYCGQRLNWGGDK